LIKNSVHNQPYNYTLCCAARHKHLTIIKLLIDRGADIHVNNDYVLCYTAQHGHLDIVMYLTDNFIFHINTLKSIKSKNVEITKIIDRLIEQS
jgi:ankyrin repeat protein